MKTKPLILVPIVLAIGACALIKNPTPLNAQVAVAQGVTVADGLYNVAGKAYKATAPSLDASTRARIKPLFAQLLTCPAGAKVIATDCTGLVAKADAAAAAGDAHNLQQMTAAVQALVSQIGNTLPK